MTAPPRRLERRRDHLAAHIVPVERALLARAEAIMERVNDLTGKPGMHKRAASLGEVAEEFRLLAEELHWQP